MVSVKDPGTMFASDFTSVHEVNTGFLHTCRTNSFGSWVGFCHTDDLVIAWTFLSDLCALKSKKVISDFFFFFFLRTYF